MSHHGSCHCGAVTFEFDGEIGDAVACNCSICRRKGSLLMFVPRDALRITAGEDRLADYTFHRHSIHHRFCPTCGIHPFGEGTDPKGNAMAVVNLRCVDGVDLDALKVLAFDGLSL
ncbi:MAG: GFA family protein [Xanthomonadales bacterium]|nr:GFA family protein [Xanthomonadales bacterium]